jgi:hypothetical protein
MDLENCALFRDSEPAIPVPISLTYFSHLSAEDSMISTLWMHPVLQVLGRLDNAGNYGDMSPSSIDFSFLAAVAFSHNNALGNARQCLRGGVGWMSWVVKSPTVACVELRTYIHIMRSQYMCRNYVS